MKRLLLALVAAALLTSPAAAAPPQRSPDVVAWWSLAPVVPGVLPPGVGPYDLYVAGSSLAPLAVAGLRFELPPAATASQLTLRLRGLQLPAVTMTACRALQRFEPVQGGPWSELPPYDCADAATARLVGGNVVVDGVDRLRRGQSLDLVLVPGPLDRVVLDTSGTGLAVTVPSAPAGRGPAPVPPPVGRPPAVVPTAPVTPTAPLPGVVTPPAVGPPAAPPVVAAPVTRPAAAVDDKPWQALLATLLIALVTFGLLLRPAPGAATPRVRGVGRLRRERTGVVPDLT